jgi:hypothetical protein
MSEERRTILLIFNNFANLFLCINASIDFILYCFLSEKFARTCKQIICRQCSNHKINAIQRSRMLSLDRASFVLTNTSNNIHQQQQQQQLAVNTTNNYYTKFVQTLTTRTTTNNQIDNQIFYQTSLIEKKQRFLNGKRKHNQQSSIRYHKSMEILPNTELNTSLTL